MIERHKEITADIQAKRRHIRGLEESNKGIRTRISMTRGSIQTDTARREVYRTSIENHERTIQGYRKLLLGLEGNHAKKMECREETQKSGVIVVVLDNAKAIEKLRGDIVKRTLDLKNEREQVRALTQQIVKSEAQLVVLLDTPVVGADVIMSAFEGLLENLNLALK